MQFKQVFKKSSADVAEQKAAFVAFFEQNAENVRAAVMSKIPTLQSVATKLRCINVPVRLPVAAAAAASAANAAAAEPPKAEMNDNLYCRVALFMTFSGVDESTAALFGRYDRAHTRACVTVACVMTLTRYFANDHSRNRAAMDGSEMSSSDLLRALADCFNDSDDFDQYCHDDLTIDMLPAIFQGLHPEHLPSPGRVTSDQLMTMIRWSRKTATRLIQM
jgi:hypothetical protein